MQPNESRGGKLLSPSGFNNVHSSVYGLNSYMSFDDFISWWRPPIKYILFLLAIKACFDLEPGKLPFFGLIYTQLNLDSLSSSEIL